jgi:branched-chain amino acid transport system permease protein
MAEDTTSRTEAGSVSQDRSRLTRALESLTRVQLWGGVLVLLAVVYATPLFVEAYYVQVLFSVFLFTALALGWNLLSGFTGYVNFGYAGFVGFGAYLTVLSIVELGYPWYGGLAVGAVGTALVGTVISAPILRLRGAYFAIAMLSLATAARLATTTRYLSPITGGGTGVSFLPALGYTDQYYLAATVTAGLGYLTYRVATSPFGLRLLAIREDETLAAALGVKTTREKILAMALHAAVAGLVGGILAFNLAYIDPPTVYGIKYTEFPIVMVLFGGLGTVLGPILGAVVFVLLFELLWSSLPQGHLFFFGLTIVVVVLFVPEGVIEWLKSNGYLPRWRSI